MYIRTAQRLGIDNFTGDRFDHFGSGEEHERLLFHHDDQVCQGRGVGCAACTGPEHHADLRNHTGVLRVAPEDLSIAAHRTYTFLNACAARVDQRDERHAVSHCQVHHAADLVRLHLAQGAAINCEIL
jgi:hypothetical protein